MIVFYRHSGPYVATSMEDGGDYVMLEGDFQFVMNISKGNSSWTYHKRFLSDYDDGTIRAVVLPDDMAAPATLTEALELRASLGLSERSSGGNHSSDSEYRVFDTFDIIGPMLMALFPKEFEEWIANSDQSNRADDFIHDVELLRSQIPEDISPNNYENSDGWSTLVSDFYDHVFFNVDAKVSGTGRDEISMLIALAPGDWIALGGFSDWESPSTIKFHHIDETLEAELVAKWLEEQKAGYAAAITLLVKPKEESEAEDEEIWDQEDELKGSFLEIGRRLSLELEVLSIEEDELIEALTEVSPQFAEFRTIISTPESEGYSLLLEAAEELHPGFAGRMGFILEWLNE